MLGLMYTIIDKINSVQEGAHKLYAGPIPLYAGDKQLKISLVRNQFENLSWFK